MSDFLPIETKALDMIDREVESLDVALDFLRAEGVRLAGDLMIEMVRRHKEAKRAYAFPSNWERKIEAAIDALGMQPGLRNLEGDHPGDRPGHDFGSTSSGRRRSGVLVRPSFYADLHRAFVDRAFYASNSDVLSEAATSELHFRGVTVRPMAHLPQGVHAVLTWLGTSKVAFIMENDDD